MVSPRLLRERLRTARSMLPGRPHEAARDGSPRWMPSARSGGCSEPGYMPVGPPCLRGTSSATLYSYIESPLWVRRSGRTPG